MLDWIIECIKEGILSIGKWIALGIIDNSYWICLFICIVAIFLYIGGLRKAGKYIPVSFIIYFLLQSIRGVLV